MKPFDENITKADKADPTAKTCVEFDLRAVEAALGEVVDQEPPSTEALRLTADMLRILTDWVMQPRRDGRLSEARVARRFIAAMWILRPDAFEGVSLRALARRLRIGRELLQDQSAAFSRRFGVQSRGQVHAWNRNGK